MKTNKIRPMFLSQVRFKAQESTTLELLVYDEIGENYWTGGGVTAKAVAAAIQAAGAFDKIAVRVNSPGGDCFEGVAIYNLLRAQGKTVDVFVDGLAASAASVIAMAGDTVSVGVGAMIMIHNAATFAYGDGPGLRKIADTLDKISETVGTIYTKKSKCSAEDVKAMMDAETWMGAQEAIDKGFADAMLNQDEGATADARALLKSFNLRHCKRVPEGIAAVKNAADECGCDCQECMNGNCEDCTNEDCTDLNCTDCPAQMKVGSKSTTDVGDEIFHQRAALYERG